MAKRCPGGFSEETKQQLRDTSSSLGLPRPAPCAICGLTVDAKLVGKEWVPVGHNAPVSRLLKGRGTKRSTGKLVIRGRSVPSRFRTAKERRKPGRRKQGGHKR